MLRTQSRKEVGRWAAALLHRARAGVVALAVAGLTGVLLSHVGLAMRWLGVFAYAGCVLGSLTLYAAAVIIGHLGNAEDFPVRTFDSSNGEVGGRRSDLTRSGYRIRTSE